MVEPISHSQGGTRADDVDASSSSEATIAEHFRSLSGDLPCARCRYNLRGLSVRGVCPECGTPVRGTILATVDPMASELMPIKMPGLVAAGLLGWAGFGFSAAVSIFLLRLEEMVRSSGLMATGQPSLSADQPWTKLLPAVFALASGICSLVLLRPHRGIPTIGVLAASLGSLAYIPLAYLLWQIHAVLDTMEPAPYTASEPAHAQIRTMLRLGVSACLAVAVLGLRPNGRLLVSRSLLMRTGKVDRQTLFVILGAVGLTALGDTLRLTNPGLMIDRAELPRLAGSVTIAVGSLLIGLGTIGVLIDAWRMRYSILSPPLSLSAVGGAPTRTPTHNSILRRYVGMDIAPAAGPVAGVQVSGEVPDGRHDAPPRPIRNPDEAP